MPKRTNTDTTDRTPQEVLALGSKSYELFSTELDTYLKYSSIDSWAKFPDFRERYNGWLRKAIAMALVRVGWYGTSAAAVTNKVTNPNGEDVNKGWFQILREYNAGAQWYLQGATANQIRMVQVVITSTSTPQYMLINIASETKCVTEIATKNSKFTCEIEGKKVFAKK